MLERMLIDISKWIIIIVIFFIAFACSLYLIFSYFAMALELHDSLNRLSNDIESPISFLTRNDTFFIGNPSGCPRIFHNLMNNSVETIIYNESTLTTHKDYIDTCKNKHTEDYGKIVKVGPRPAIHYFGRTFGSTVLTTFFTLFGAIVENGISVRMKIFNMFTFCLY
jgi:hypothetical protein